MLLNDPVDYFHFKSKLMKTVLNILAILFGLMMILFGLNKFLNFIPMPEMTQEQMDMFAAFGKISWLMPLVGAAEVLGGLLVAIPKTRALGAIVILPVMVGILLHNLFIDQSGLMIAGVMAAINAWMIGANCGKYQTLIE